MSTGPARPVVLYPGDLPDPGTLTTEEDILRAADALALPIHCRMVSAAAAAAWREKVQQIRSGGRASPLTEPMRVAFLERYVARALKDAGERERVRAAIADRLREHAKNV